MPDGPAPLGPVARVARGALVTIATLSIGLTLHAVVVSGWQHRAAQVRAYARFRDELARGTAPIAQIDARNHPLPLGAPVALIDIRSIHVHEVVAEGTTPDVLMAGAGLRRDTPLPGQAGRTVIFGRRAAYGGPFQRIGQLRKGSTITVTTGQGVSNFSVIDVRRAGAVAPPALGPGKGRLQLVTAAGTPFVPAGVVRVDANLTSPTLTSTPVPAAGVPKAEQPLGTDSSTVWALVLWLQALLAIAVGAVWSWERWGKVQTWIVFVPVAALVGLGAVGQLFRLLPNLL
jgi:LPXTG-site transpeptidase (sortase) family protein